MWFIICKITICDLLSWNWFNIHYLLFIAVRVQVESSADKSVEVQDRDLILIGTYIQLVNNLDKGRCINAEFLIFIENVLITEVIKFRLSLKFLRPILPEESNANTISAPTVLQSEIYLIVSFLKYSECSVQRVFVHTSIIAHLFCGIFIFSSIGLLLGWREAWFERSNKQICLFI